MGLKNMAFYQEKFIENTRKTTSNDDKINGIQWREEKKRVSI